MVSVAGLAQNSDIPANNLPSVPSKFPFVSEDHHIEANSGTLLLNNISIKAVRDFVTSFKHSTDVKWTGLADGFRVHFYSDDVQTRIFYDQKGNRQAMIRYYNENKLPRDVRHLVRSNYYDYSIFNITEVSKNDKTVYFVRIQDKSGWKTIRVADGEMETTEDNLKN